MADKFWPPRRQEQQDISRDQEQLNNAGPYHTIRQPQDQEAYDPWADWFNAGLDPEPFTDNFYVEPEESNNLVFFEESPDHSAPWYIPEEQHNYQGALENPQAQQEYPEEDHYRGYQDEQDDRENQDQGSVRDEEQVNFIGVSSSVQEEETPVEASQSSEQNQEEGADSPPNQEQLASETTEVQVKSNAEDVNRVNQEPLVWKDFPEKGC